MPNHDMAKRIKEIKACEILDSRGNPTIETKVMLNDGTVGKASVPSGASKGKYEALDLRDGDKKRYNGLGVLKAIDMVNKIIAPKLKGMRIIKQQRIDNVMIGYDGTPNKTKLGANSILSVSLACARAGAISFNVPLYFYLRKVFKYYSTDFKMPSPMFNIINGGKHADSGLQIQEFIIIPQQKNFSEKVRAGAEIFQALKNILKQKKMVVAVGDEGGFAPRLKSNQDAFELIKQAVNKARYKFGAEIKLGIDVASSSFYDKKTSLYEIEKGKRVSRNKLIDLYGQWIKKYPIISIEDGMDQDDAEGWKIMAKALRGKVKLIGDDLFVTNAKRLLKGIENRSANGIIIKPNQIGSLTETWECVKIAKDNNYKIVTSHRSGETCDTFISDLAVAVGADYIKAGSLSRGERVEKYNRLMEIEKML